MGTIVLTYEGYSLYAWGPQYKSEIDGQWIQFDTASRWKQYIDKITRRSS